MTAALSTENNFSQVCFSVLFVVFISVAFFWPCSSRPALDPSSRLELHPVLSLSGSGCFLFVLPHVSGGILERWTGTQSLTFGKKKNRKKKKKRVEASPDLVYFRSCNLKFVQNVNRPEAKEAIDHNMASGCQSWRQGARVSAAQKRLSPTVDLSWSP